MGQKHRFHMMSSGVSADPWASRARSVTVWFQRGQVASDEEGQCFQAIDSIQRQGRLCVLSTNKGTRSTPGGPRF